MFRCCQPAFMVYLPQCPQLAQWPPPQDAQPPPLWLLATSRLPPPLSFLTAANSEIIRRPAVLAHCGQAIGRSASLMGRSASKGPAHCGQ